MGGRRREAVGGKGRGWEEGGRGRREAVGGKREVVGGDKCRGGAVQQRAKIGYEHGSRKKTDHA